MLIKLSWYSNLFATLTYFPSQELDKQMMAIMAEEIEPLKNQSGFFPNVIIQPYAAGAIAAGKARGGNAYGIDVDGPLSGELQYPQNDPLNSFPYPPAHVHPTGEIHTLTRTNLQLYS